MPMSLTLDGETLSLDILALSPTLRVRLDGVQHAASETPTPHSACVHLTVDGVTHEVWRVIDGERMHVRVGGRTWSVLLEDLLALDAEGSESDEVKAAMPGVVVAVRVAVGDRVTAGQTLLVIESMKMQVALTAPREGVIAAVQVTDNESFQKGAVLVALSPETAP